MNKLLTKYIILVCFTYSIHAFSQNYNKADTFCFQISKNKYNFPEDIVKEVEQKFSNPHDKYRVYFRWICENLKYNKNLNLLDANRVFKTKNAACGGYASLLKYFCDKSGIECITIDGYAKSEIRDIDNIKKPNHTWNAIKLNDKWYLSDATFASLNVIEGKNIYKFDETFFLSDPSYFILNHLPKDGKYQFLTKKIKRSTFLKWPMFYSDFYKSNLKIDTKSLNGVIKNELKLNFLNFESDEKKFFLTDLQQNFNPTMIHINNDLKLSYKLPETSQKEIDLYYNNKAIMGFRKK